MLEDVEVDDTEEKEQEIDETGDERWRRRTRWTWRKRQM